MRVAINAQIIPDTGAGGIETVLRFLTKLGRLEGDEEYIFIGHWADESDWLKPLLGERQTWIKAPRPQPSNLSRSETIKQSIGPLRPFARGLKQWFTGASSKEPAIPVSDGFYESLCCDVIHFPYQDFVRTNMPAIFNPHDVQHLHLPQYFSADEIRRREAIYPAACRAAQMVVAGSKFVMQDLVEEYGLAADKIQVIPWGPTDVEVGESTAIPFGELRDKYDCPADPFALYPAVTWEHKNHVRLIEAIALLRDRDKLRVNLVCTGHNTSFFPVIEKRLNELQLEDQVKFMGVVDRRELSTFYRRAQFVIIPTLFEAASAPVFESWHNDVAVACSSVTSLPEQVGNAALLFDPTSVDEIADAIKRMTLDPVLRVELRSLGNERRRKFDPERTAKMYRAVYRRTAGVTLNEEDLKLLNTTPISDPLKENV